MLSESRVLRNLQRNPALPDELTSKVAETVLPEEYDWTGPRKDLAV